MRKLSFLLFFFVVSCSRTPPLSDEVVVNRIGNRLGKQVSWGSSEKFDDFIQQVSHGELTVDLAVQIALLNNPKIQAMFEEIGIAHADLIEAGLYSNPVFEIFFRFPDEKNLVMDIDSQIMGVLLDLFMVPLRKKVAQADLERVQFEVSQQVLDLTCRVQEVYYRLSFAQSHSANLKAITELNEAEYEIHRVQQKAGNIYQVRENEAKAAALFADIEMNESLSEIIQYRKELNQLMGFGEDVEGWRVPCTDKELPKTPDSLEVLQKRALESRFDLCALYWDLQRIARTGATKKWWAYTEAMLGAASEREPEGSWITGPAIGGAIPIFNYGQADRARLRSFLRQRTDQYLALKIAILNEVGAAFEKQELFRKAAIEYASNILPTRSIVVNETQRLYHVMALSPFALLQIEQDFLNQIQYMRTLRDFWIARVHLTRAVGGRL
ncbi:MAG: TolC family protein [Chlamydiales bacterium]